MSRETNHSNRVNTAGKGHEMMVFDEYENMNKLKLNNIVLE